jgi:precorrin-6B methylase 1
MTTKTPTTLALNTASASLPIASQTAFTDASSFTIAYPVEGKLLLVINSTYAGANTAVIAAGDGLSSGIGALTITTAQNGVYYLVVDSSRFKTLAAGAGYITMTFGTSNTGFIHAFYLP